MVVDIDHERGAAEEGRIVAESRLVGTVHRQQDARSGVRGKVAPGPPRSHGPVLAGRRCRGQLRNITASLPSSRSRRGGEQRPEGVAIGVLVRHHQEAVVLAEDRGDRL